MTTTPPTLKELQKWPHMTGWFGPWLLLKLLGRVIISDMFGQYADRRLIIAALDPVTPKELVERAQYFMPGRKNEEVKKNTRTTSDRATYHNSRESIHGVVRFSYKGAAERFFRNHSFFRAT